MTSTELNNNLTSLLKKYIKSRGYVASGKLVNSISFNITDSRSGLVSIELSSVEYIQYLDDGELVSKFFERSEVLELIATYEAEKIEKMFKNFK